MNLPENAKIFSDFDMSAIREIICDSCNQPIGGFAFGLTFELKGNDNIASGRVGAECRCSDWELKIAMSKIVSIHREVRTLGKGMDS